jgi:uncharacterized protein YbjT (DUF2867 family)
MILVTGATGNIGSEVVRLLRQRGQRVRVLVRDPKKLAGVAPGDEGIEAFVGDLSRPETLPPALAGVTKLFLMAHAPDLPEVTRNVLRAAEQSSLRHVVLISSSTVYIEPEVTLGRWHREAEDLLKESGLAYTILRPGQFASNARMWWAGSIRAQGAVYLQASQARTAPIDPRDIAAVAVCALTEPGHEGRTYRLIGPPPHLSAADQVRILSEALGRPLRVVEVTEAAAREGMLRSGAPLHLVDAVTEAMRSSAAEGDEVLSPDVHEVTKREPRSFAEWVKDHLDAFR